MRSCGALPFVVEMVRWSDAITAWAEPALHRTHARSPRS